MELPDDVGADLACGGQGPKEIPTRRWSERVSEASRILPKHRGASVSVPGPQASYRTSSTASKVESEGRAVTLRGARGFGYVPRNSAGTSVQAVIGLGPGLLDDGSSDVNVTT